MEKKNEFHEKNLDRVNYWLQFAEAKNSAVIAFVVAILAVIYSSRIIENTILVLIITTIYMAALVLSILSFYPQYKKDVSKPDGKYDDTKDNLIFWKDLAKYSANDYINAVNKEFFADGNKGKITKQELMYAEEIISNSRIARYKYKMFEYSVKISIAASVLIPVFLLIIA